MTDDEHALGAPRWAAWDDPFPAWETYGLDEACDHEQRSPRGRAGTSALKRRL